MSNLLNELRFKNISVPKSAAQKRFQYRKFLDYHSNVEKDQIVTNFF